jgi:hypothetical protein
MLKRGKISLLVLTFLMLILSLLFGAISVSAVNSGTGCWSDGACGDVNLKSDTCYYDTY